MIHPAPSPALSQGRSAALDALSRRMMRHGDVAEWRALFLGPNLAQVRFETMTFTLVAADAPLECVTDDERLALATRFEGMMQPSGAVDLLLCFRDPARALAAAVGVQRLAGARKVRTAISTAPCTVAFFRGRQGDECLIVGAGVERAEQALDTAPHGTVTLEGGSYGLLEGRLSEHAPDALVMTEMDDDTVTGASITLAPHQSAAMSTFVGLGMARD